MKFYPAYTNRRPTYKKGNKKSPGVYLIKQNGRIMYVGFSLSDVHKTAYRHFQSWNDRTQYRATFPKNALLYILPTTKAKAKKLEAALIRKHQPAKNTYQPTITYNEPVYFNGVEIPSHPADSPF